MGRGSFWLNPGFTRLWLGQTVSAFGSPFTAKGCHCRGDRAQHLRPPVQSLGGSCGGSGAAFRAGRRCPVRPHRRRPVLVTADLRRAVVLLLAPIAAWLGFLRLELLIFVALVSGALIFLPNYRRRPGVHGGPLRLVQADAGIPSRSTSYRRRGSRGRVEPNRADDLDPDRLPALAVYVNRDWFNVWGPRRGGRGCIRHLRSSRHHRRALVRGGRPPVWALS